MFRNPMSKAETLYTAEVELEFGGTASFSNVVSASQIANGVFIVRLWLGINEFVVQNARGFNLIEQEAFVPP